jgi:protein-tyrosine phosphatase
LTETKKILFVCLGNIVRSPLAENMFRQIVQEAALGEKYQADSAGTEAFHIGEKADSRMRQVADQRGLHYIGSGRQFVQKDFENFDLILPMDTSNFSNLERLTIDKDQLAKLQMMGDFDLEAGKDRSVPDPYYGGIDGFEFVYEMIERSTIELLRQLESGKLKI